MRRLLALTALGLVPASAAHGATLERAPTGLTGTSTRGGRVELAWQPVRGARGYQVYRASSAKAARALAASSTFAAPVASPSEARFADAGVADGERHYYAVKTLGLGTSPASDVVGVTARAASCDDPNPVAAENCQPGTTDWKQVDGAPPGLGGIEGFASETSVEAGQPVDLKINTQPGVPYKIEVYRSGWYGGTQGRLVSTVIPNHSGVAQPPCEADATTGLKDCANWSTTDVLTTSADWVSGVYLLRLVRTDTNSASHILLIVRNDDRCVDLTYVVPVTTYQAYNDWGGKSAYNFNSSGDPTPAAGTAPDGKPARRAVKISFNRPYTQDPPERNWYTEVDVQNVSWFEREGYNLSYATSVDLHRDVPHVENRKALISASHDEYWSKEMRQAATAARDAGVGQLFLGSNAAYWKIRFEDRDRHMVVYKTTESGSPDPSGEPTTTWRDPAGANRPESALVGQQYIGDNDNAAFPLVIDHDQGRHRIWRHTSLASLPEGQTDSINGLVGWEWDARASNGQEPAEVQTFAASPVNGLILKDAGRVYAPGNATQHSTAYRAASGAWVVATGTNYWSRGLGTNVRGQGEPHRAIMQATINALRDMDAAPSTPAGPSDAEPVTVDPGASPPRCPTPPSPPRGPRPGPGGGGGAPPASAPAATSTPATPPRLPGAALEITSIRREGAHVSVRGTIAGTARGRVMVSVDGRTAEASVRDGRWSVRMPLDRRARRVRVRVTWAGDA